MQLNEYETEQFVAKWMKEVANNVINPTCKHKWEEEMKFEKELEMLINKHSKENESDTPDFILAQYLKGCLANYAETVKARDKWYGSKGLSERSSSI